MYILCLVLILDKIVEVQMIIQNLDGSTNYIVYIFINSVLIGKETNI